MPMPKPATIAPEKPDYYDAMPADIKAHYDAASPERQLLYQQGIAELREILQKAEASGVSKRSFGDAIKKAEDKLRAEGVIGHQP